MSRAVLRLAETDAGAVRRLLARYRLRLCRLPAGAEIPGSYWGAPEAGLRGNHVYARADTPVHSILHESAHVICMERGRRLGLDTDAGGDDSEEAAVCYLQVLLSEWIPACGRERMLADMDAWGYSFRLGSASRWFSVDAEDARSWLASVGVIDERGAPTWALRGARHTATMMARRCARDG